MCKQSKGYISYIPANKNKTGEEITWVSKSQIKRDAVLLKKLGAELVCLGKKTLDQISLDEDLHAAIVLAQKLTKEGRRRQLQFIGKILRSCDAEQVKIVLDKLKKHL